MSASLEISGESWPSLPFGRRLNLPYLMGVYLGVNAVRDAWLVVDGPDCSHFKGQFIFGKHDWHSTLYRADGRHRVVFTGTNAQDIAPNRDDLVAGTISRAMVDEASAVLLTSMPLCGITGTQYDRIIDDIEPRVPVLEIPGRSLRGDWLDGYSETLAALARGRKIRAARAKRTSVAVVGHLMDRNEGDQTGNIAEMTRLLSRLGLEVAAVWPDGGDWSGLDRVSAAGTIISLPYGRAAAGVVAEKTGAGVIETGVPCGLDGTSIWVQSIGRALGRETRAKKLVESELDRIIPKISRSLPFYFLNRGAAVLADPHLLPGFAGLCADVGMRLRFVASIGREGHGVPELPSTAPANVVEPMEGDIHRMLSESGLGANDLVMCNGELSVFLRRRFAVVEIGVPSYSHHVFTPTPFLGFEGALHLLNRMANALSEAFV